MGDSSGAKLEQDADAVRDKLDPAVWLQQARALLAELLEPCLQERITDATAKLLYHTPRPSDNFNFKDPCSQDFADDLSPGFAHRKFPPISNIYNSGEFFHVEA